MISMIRYTDDFALKVIIFMFPLVFLAIGLFSIHSTNTKLANCTEETNAVITCVKEDDGVYALNYDYTYNGKTYHYSGNMYTSENSVYSVGDTISILVNPNNPDEQLFNATSYSSFGKIFAISGVALYGFYAIIDIIDLISRINKHAGKQNKLSGKETINE